MNIFSRRKRLLNRTSARVNSGPTVSGHAQFRKIFRRNRIGTPGMPKMSSRRQFHRALRRHPAWPAVMELAAARAQAQKAAQRDRAGVMEMGTASHQKRLRRILNRNRTGVMTTGQASSSRTGVRRILRRNRTNVIAMGQTTSRIGLRRAIRRNRTLVVALLAVGALVALLTGLAVADGFWVSPDIHGHPAAARGRFGAATTFDGTNNEMLIFGGFTVAEKGATPVAANDTWGFRAKNGTGGTEGTWFNRTAINAPSPRGYAAMAYDAARRNVVLFGGAPYNSSVVSDETWIWNGSDWTKANPPEPRPPARQNASIAYDAHRKVVVMFGGRGATADVGNRLGLPLDDTWTWDGAKWTKMKPPVSPSARHSAAMAYDLCRAETVIFGGAAQTPIGGPIQDASVNTASVAGETWTWDGITWTPEEPVLEWTPYHAGTLVKEDPAIRTPVPGAPPARIGGSMAYSPVTGRALLYGGFTTFENNQAPIAGDPDVWMWDGAGWEKMASETGVSTMAIEFLAPRTAGPPAPPRSYTSFAFSPAGESMAYVFGGTPAGHPDDLPIILHSLAANLARNKAHQDALSDNWIFEENAGQPARKARGCYSPVPIPPDGASTEEQVTQGPPRKLNTREEIKEIGRLPVLLGTPWPAQNRNPTLNITPQNPNGTPNPHYTPPPDCPASNTSDSISNTYLTTDPKRNRIYQFYFCDRSRPGQQPNVVNRLLIQAYDGSTLKPLRSAVVPINDSVQFHSVNPFRPWSGPPQHDPQRGRFLFSGGDDLFIVRQDHLESGIDPLTKITISGLGTRWTFFNHPKTGRAKLLLSGGSTISQLDEYDKRIDWTRSSIQGCSGEYSWAMRSEDRVYFACGASVVRLPVLTTQNDPVANDGEEVSSSTPQVFPGPKGAARVFLDPQAERVVLVSNADDGSSSSLWIFDGKVSRYVGRLGVADTYLPGQPLLDRETGRLYGLLPDHKGVRSGSSTRQGGLIVVDTRLIPVPEALNFGQFSYTSEAYIGVLPPRDGLPRRVLVRRGSYQTPTVHEGHPDYPTQAKAYSDPVKRYPDGEELRLVDEMHYKVLADELPLPEQPDIGDLDALTIAVAEKPGKTEAIFGAEGSAYGIRLRSVGGLASAPPTPIPQSLEGQKTVPACLFPDRELMAGWVSQANLSDLETTARSSGLEVDSSSKVDLEGATTRCQIPGINAETFSSSVRPYYKALWPLIPFTYIDSSLGANLKWDNHFKKVECVGDSNENHRATLGHLTVPAGSAQGALPPGTIPPGTIPSAVTSTVTVPTGGVIPVGDVYGSTVCKQKDGLVQGTARGALGGSATPAEYSVGEGYSNVVVTKEPVRGVVVTSTAVATGIKIGPVSIGYVKTEAVTWSNGRPHDGPRVSFTRTICRGTSPSQSSCFTTKEEQEKFVADLNQILTNSNINGRATLPTYDPDYYKGSPGGYAAGVIKPIVDEIEERIFVNDSQKEVAGLTIVFYKDTQKTYGRQVLELAGVRAFTGYGIQCTAGLVYSPTSKDCIELAFEDDFETQDLEDEEYFEEGTESTEGAEGYWVEAGPPLPTESVGSRIGRFLGNLPVFASVPLRQIGEALLTASVWMLLGLPLVLAGRRLTIKLNRD